MCYKIFYSKITWKEDEQAQDWLNNKILLTIVRDQLLLIVVYLGCENWI